MPTLGGKQPGDGVEGGGLAGTVRAEHGHDLAGLGGECDVEGETVTVNVGAADDLAVVSVTLDANDDTIATDTSAPYQFVFTAPVGAPNMTLRATAGDFGNNIGVSEEIVINVIPDPPQSR